MNTRQYVQVVSSGLKSVNEFDFEDRIDDLAHNFQGKLDNTLYTNFGKKRTTFTVSFKSAVGAQKFRAEVGKRARVWKIKAY